MMAMAMDPAFGGAGAGCGGSLRPIDDLAALFDQPAAPPAGDGPVANDPMLASLRSLVGPVDLMSLGVDDMCALEATIEVPEGGVSPLLSSCSGSDSGDDAHPPFTPLAAGLTNDRFLYDWSPRRLSYDDVPETAAVATSGHLGGAPFTASPERPPHAKSTAAAPRQPRPKQTKPFNKKKAAGKHSSQISAVSSKLASALLPKVDKPSLGELNGKMPRPVVVNASPRRRRKSDKVSDEQIMAEEEARKIKSVQSARDCRKRKKQYIQGLQLAIQQYEHREAAAQRLIATLESSIARIRAATAV